VIVKRMDEGSLKSSVIEVVTLNREPSQYAMVMSVGQGTRVPLPLPNAGKRIPNNVKPGDVVILKPNSGAPVTINGEDYHIVTDDDCLAVVER
jgi:chaperonin GroES